MHGPLATSIVGRAQERGLVHINPVDLRGFTHDAHRTVDDKPYGGGPGMLMKIEPLVEAVEALRSPDAKVVLTGPCGEKFRQRHAQELASEKHLIFICGHYEGVDERVRQALVDREFSIGDYVLTSGNLPALVMIDAIVRLRPGFGFAGIERLGVLLRRPPGISPIHQGAGVQGDEGSRRPDFAAIHAKIAKWRRERALETTRLKSPTSWRTMARTAAAAD
jgi:tRNA (guanine37-N1)-methyltransferase